jgi:hypothetical protein
MRHEGLYYPLLVTPHSVTSILHTPCAGFSKTGARYQVSGTGYLAPGTRYPAPKPVRRRGPNTEHRRPSPATRKRAHEVCIQIEMGEWCQVPGKRNPSPFYLAYPVCAFFEDRSRYRVPGSGYLAPGTRDPVPDQRRRPNTEYRRPSLATRKRAHRVCILYSASVA